MRRYSFVILGISLIMLFGNDPAGRAEETTLKKNTVSLPAQTLSADQIVALFSDKTVHSVTVVQGRKSVSYYAPNGEIRQLRKGIKRFGHWRVIDNGRICLQMEDRPEKCRIIVAENKGYTKYIVKKNGAHQASVFFTDFKDGNPLGL